MIKAGLIAAGVGSRFKEAGFETPKPLIKVLDRPLIGWSLEQFSQAGLTNLVAIFNESNCKPCLAYIESEFSQMELDVNCRNTETSFESFQDVLERGNGHHLLITTTDSIYPPGTLNRLLEFAKTLPGDTMILGVTDFIDDEKPLFAKTDSEGKITGLGGQRTDLVTNGVYLMPPHAHEMGVGRKFPALRKFLAFLIENGVECRGFNMGKSVDVDRPADLEQAEKFAATFRGIK